MKKTHIQLIIIVGVGYLLVTLLDSRQWNIMVYSLLLLIIIASIVQDVLSIIKTTKGMYTDGEVVRLTRQVVLSCCGGDTFAYWLLTICKTH